MDNPDETRSLVKRITHVSGGCGCAATIAAIRRQEVEKAAARRHENMRQAK